MSTFLLKTEPSKYSIDDLAADVVTIWDGVRNRQAVAAIRKMQPGDRALIYHSGATPAIVGQAQIISDPQPDNRDSRSWTVQLKYLNHFERPVTLSEIKACGLFDDWVLVRQGWLSVIRVPDDFLVWFWAQVE